MPLNQQSWVWFRPALSSNRFPCERSIFVAAKSSYTAAKNQEGNVEFILLLCTGVAIERTSEN